MSERRRTAASPALAAALALLAGTAPALAAPPTKADAACMESAERAQRLRRQGKLGATRAALETCAAEACPAVVRDDCRTWTDEVQAAQPSIVFSVRGTDGADLVAAKVLVDGSTFLERVDGRALPIDPGPHDVEVAAPAETPVRLRIVVHEGEKARVVPVAFRTVRPPDEATRAWPITPWVYVTGALTAAGVAGFAFLGLTALSEHAALRDGCALTHACTDDQIQSNRTRFWLADASLFVGLLAGGATGFILYEHASGGRSRASLGPAARAGDVRVSTRCGSGPLVELRALF